MDICKHVRADLLKTLTCLQVELYSFGNNNYTRRYCLVESNVFAVLWCLWAIKLDLSMFFSVKADVEKDMFVCLPKQYLYLGLNDLFSSAGQEKHKITLRGSEPFSKWVMYIFLCEYLMDFIKYLLDVSYILLRVF